MSVIFVQSNIDTSGAAIAFCVAVTVPVKNLPVLEYPDGTVTCAVIDLTVLEDTVVLKSAVSATTTAIGDVTLIIPALFTEVVGQASHFIHRGFFPEQKIAFLEGFDYVNIGVVDPTITGYELDPEKKILVPVES